MGKGKGEQTFLKGINRNSAFAGFVIAYGSSFQFGYNVGVLNEPSDHINEFYNDTYIARRDGVPLKSMDITILWSFTTALMFIPGGIIGAFLGGIFGDKLGRRGGILVSHTFLIVGVILSVLCVKAKSPELLLIGRMFIGVNLGIGNCIAPMYLQEIVKPNLRGAFGTFHQLAITLGIFIGSVFGLPQILGDDGRWQYLILLELIPVSASFALMPIIYESPRYLLISKKDRDGARRSLEFYLRSKSVDDELKEMEEEAMKMANIQQRSIRQMFAKDIRRALIIACVLQLIQQFSGCNAVFFFSGSVFKHAGVDAKNIPYAIMGTNALNVVLTVAAVPLMDYVGRRKLLLYPMLEMIVVLAVLTVCISFQKTQKSLAYISIICILCYVVAFAVGLGPIPWMVGSELFRQDARSKAMSFCGIINLLATFIIALGFEPVQEVLTQYTFIIFIGCLICGFFFVLYFVPETKNRTFQDVAEELSGGTVAPVAESKPTDLEVTSVTEEPLVGAEKPSKTKLQQTAA